jgi:hypothetical protein
MPWKLRVLLARHRYLRSLAIFQNPDIPSRRLKRCFRGAFRKVFILRHSKVILDAVILYRSNALAQRVAEDILTHRIAFLVNSAVLSMVPCRSLI